MQGASKGMDPPSQAPTVVVSSADPPSPTTPVLPQNLVGADQDLPTALNLTDPSRLAPETQGDASSPVSPTSPTSQRVAGVKAGVTSTKEIKECCPSNGRNLSVSFDGTLGEFGVMNSNVIEFNSRIIKDKKQLSNYISGIGTRGSSIISRKIDSAIATTFQSSVLMGYEWLCNQYKPGDRIFLFGFSRGAYQARVVAGMIERVGLLYRGNNSQLPSVFKLYMAMEESSTSSATTAVAEPNPTFGPKLETDMNLRSKAEERVLVAKEKCSIFKKAFSRPSVKVHFVGAWDTVSSIGIALKPCFPETVDGMSHVCHFRHALALDERRVKFWPEYANTDAPSSGAQRGDIKEVWFAGSHSDIGGGGIANPKLANFGPALRWMTYEAMFHGLRMEQYLGIWKDIEPSTSLKGLWWNLLEILPLRRPSGVDGGRTTRVPHLGAPRRIHKGQFIHESVFKQMGFDLQSTPGDKDHAQGTGGNSDIATKELPSPLSVIVSQGTAGKHGSYKPPAIFYDTAVTWENIDLLREMIEADYFSSAASAVHRLKSAYTNKDDKELLLSAIQALHSHVLSAPRLKSLAEVPGVLGLLLEVLKVLSSLTPDKTRAVDSSFATRVIFSALAYVPSQPSHKFAVKDFRTLASQPFKIIPEHIYRDVIIRHGDGKLEEISTGVKGTLEYISFSRDQDLIFCGSYEEVAIWNLETKTTTQSVPLGRIETVEISADGSQFVIGLGDHVQLWDVHTGARVQDFVGHSSTVLIVTLSSDGKMASGSMAGSIRMWDLKSGEDLHGDMDRHWGPIWELAFSADNTRLVSGGHDTTVRLWDTNTGDHLMVLRGHTDEVWSVAYSRDGAYIISGSTDTTVRVWDAKSGDVRTLEGHMDVVTCLAFSKDGTLIASGGQDRTLRVWDASTGEALVIYDVGIRLRSLAFSPDDKQLIVGCAYGKIFIWDAEVLL
ncbi:hypothetical protein PTI98_002255 [Pleurotus ostreatus]|nr:hypothetical protein PTI98_002255 [Pleurotus ostreatus]